MHIDIDTHIHTPASKCCFDPEQTVANVAERLAARGFRLIAITDHVWVNPDIPPNAWYARHDGTELLQTVRSIRNVHFPLKVLASCEADMQAPGRYGITDEFAEQLDYVSLATDHFQLRDFVQQPSAETPEAIAETMLAFFDDAVRWGKAQVLLHPLFPNSYQNFYDAVVDSISDARFLDSLGPCAEKKLALEINIGILNCGIDKGAFHLESLLRVFSLAKKAGCLFTIGSDAHNAEHFTHYDRGEDFIQRLGLTSADLHPIVR